MINPADVVILKYPYYTRVLPLLWNEAWSWCMNIQPILLDDDPLSVWNWDLDRNTRMYVFGFKNAELLTEFMLRFG